MYVSKHIHSYIADSDDGDGLYVATGEYMGFDEEQPTCRDNGKAVVIQQLKDKFGYRRLVHIGDGVTDLEACPPAVRLQFFPVSIISSASWLLWWLYV